MKNSITSLGIFFWVYWAFYTIHLFSIYWLRLISLIFLAHKTSFRTFETEAEMFQIFRTHLKKTYWFNGLDFSYPKITDELSLPTDLKTCFWIYNKFRNFLFLRKSLFFLMFLIVSSTFVLTFVHSTVIICVMSLALFVAKTNVALMNVFWFCIGWQSLITLLKIFKFFMGYKSHVA